MTRLTRRFVVGAAAAACCGVGLLQPAAAAAEDRLRALLGDPAGAGVLGRAYLALAPQEGARLAELVLRSLGLDRATLARETERGLRRRLAARVRQDYAEDATAVVGGWVLSRTEGRLAALWA